MNARTTLPNRYDVMKRCALPGANMNSKNSSLEFRKTFLFHDGVSKLVFAKQKL